MSVAWRSPNSAITKHGRRTGLRDSAGLGGLFLASLGLRLYPVVALHFDGLYGQDPYAYYSYGQQLRDALARFQLPGKFYWPLGYPALVSLGFGISGERPPGPQILTLVSGALVCLFTFLLTVELIMLWRPEGSRFARIAGLVAWAIVAACGQLIQSSMVIMADAPGMMWATLSAWALVRYARTRSPRWIALSSFALAWATMTRWQYGSLAAVWGVWVLALPDPKSVSGPVPARKMDLLLKRAFHYGVAVVVGLLTLAPQIAHTLQNPDPLIGHQWVQGWAVSNAFTRDFVSVDGTFHYSQTPAEYYAQPLYNPYFMSWLFIPFIVIGAGVLTKHRTGIFLLGGWFLVQYGFLAGIPYQNIRFILSEFPPLAVLAGVGAAWLITFSVRRYTRVALTAVCCAAIVAGLLMTLRASVPVITNFVDAKNADLSATLWINSQVAEPGATVYCLDLLLTMQHYTALNAVQIFDLTPEALSKQLAGRSQPTYAVFNLWTTEHQWYGKSPWIIYHWLKDNPGLTEVGTNGYYTLFRIGQWPGEAASAP